MTSSEIRKGVNYRAVRGPTRLVVRIYKRPSDRTRYVVYRHVIDDVAGEPMEMRIDLFAATCAAPLPAAG